MRVGILTYPMLFQRDSALRGELRALLAAFDAMAPTSTYGKTEAALLDPLRENLDDYDVIHVIGAGDGNHAMVEMAAACGIPVVLTPRLEPSGGRADAVRARAAERLLAYLARHALPTCDGQLRRAMAAATLVVAQGGRERRAIADVYGVPPRRLRLVPRGVDQALFEADAALFRQRTAIAGEFALMAGPLSPRHGQLAIARELHEMLLPLVVVGGAADAQGNANANGNANADANARGDADYLRQLRAVPGVRMLGELADQPRLRASAFAAAGVLIAPPDEQGGDGGALAALAAGTAVLADAGYAEDLPEGDYAVTRLRWHDSRARKAAIVGVLEAPPIRERVRSLVREHAWRHVAARLVHCYADAIALRGPAPNVFVGTAGARRLRERAWR